MNVFETDFKVGMQVRMFHSYGSFYTKEVIQEITPKGKFIKVRFKNYVPISKKQAIRNTRWGQESITIIEEESE